MQPYFMSGGYFESSFSRFKEESVTTWQSGPEEYGYYRKGDIHLYDFEKPVSSIAERGTFLFQDRIDLANDAENDNTIRIFFLGGSAAYGIGASSIDKRWYVLLEKSLTASLGRNVKLIPAAMIGYVSTQERLVLDLMVMPRRPDAVIIFDGFNDAVLPSIFGTRPGDPYDQGIFYQEFYSPLSVMKKWLANYSYSYRYLLYRSLARAIDENQRLILEDPDRLKNYGQSTASVYVDNVTGMLKLCSDRHIPCMVFLQPVRDLTLRYQGITNELDLFTLTSYDEMQNRIRNPELAGNVHDLTHIFDATGAERNYMDNVHFLDGGHQAVADAMYPIVLSALKERIKPAASH